MTGGASAAWSRALRDPACGAQAADSLHGVRPVPLRGVRPVGDWVGRGAGGR